MMFRVSYKNILILIVKFNKFRSTDLKVASCFIEFCYIGSCFKCKIIIFSEKTELDYR